MAIKPQKLTINVNATLVYLGNVDDRYPRDEQLADCRKVVKELELPAIGRAIYEHGKLRDLIKDLSGNELVLLPDLKVLAEYRGKGVSDRFLFNLIAVISRTYMVMDAHNRLNSHDGDKWIQHVKATRDVLTNSRPLSSDDATKRAKASHKKKVKAKPGIVRLWKKHVKVKDPEKFERMASHWRDPDHDNAQDAIDSFPDDELLKASRKTIERIFGNRTTKKNTNK